MVVARTKKNAGPPTAPAEPQPARAASNHRARPAATKVAAAQAHPEKTSTGKRQRLAKVFSRPLDKKLKKAALVRERFTFPEAEFERLVAIKKRLAEDGISIKKSELLRAGLLLLDAVDDETLKAVLARIPPVA